VLLTERITYGSNEWDLRETPLTIRIIDAGPTSEVSRTTTPSSQRHRISASDGLTEPVADPNVMSMTIPASESAWRGIHQDGSIPEAEPLDLSALRKACLRRIRESGAPRSASGTGSIIVQVDGGGAVVAIQMEVSTGMPVLDMALERCVQDVEFLPTNAPLSAHGAWQRVHWSVSRRDANAGG
jgi:outer membrane biosynthesis protein TonB